SIHPSIHPSIQPSSHSDIPFFIAIKPSEQGCARDTNKSPVRRIWKTALTAFGSTSTRPRFDQHSISREA
ncbi:hypothetical protein J010_03179, partial [Cryptococcus neoformans]